jgi:hypothetical protein
MMVVDYRPVSGSPVKQGDDAVVLPRSSAELVLRLFTLLGPEWHQILRRRSGSQSKV